MLPTADQVCDRTALSLLDSSEDKKVNISPIDQNLLFCLRSTWGRIDQDYLEPSPLLKCSIFCWFSGSSFGFLNVPEYSFSGTFLGHDQIGT